VESVPVAIPALGVPKGPLARVVVPSRKSTVPVAVLGVTAAV
jgi:hypothetical protein